MTRSAEREVTVLGAGVAGLTTAVCLIEAGLAVRIVSAEEPQLTTSAAATGLVGLAFAQPMDKVPGWERLTVEALTPLVDVAGTGVRVLNGLMGSREPMPAPPPFQSRPGYRQATERELPAGFGGGFWLDMHIVDMTQYLPYLRRRFEQAGGSIEIRRVDSLEELGRETPVVANCSGVGARQLAGDETVQPSYGMHLIIENPGLDYFFMEGPPGAPHWLSWTPHGERMLIGGVSVVDRWDREADLDVAASLLERAKDANPLFANAKVIGDNVGLRPQRPAVRVEEERLGNLRCIHNYGHGGQGVTLSWGCAREVVSILEGESTC